MFSAYIGYQSWYEFKKSFFEETADLEDEVESLPEPELEEKIENTTSLLDTKITENPPKEKKGGPRGATVKRRVQCPPLDAGRLTASGRDFIASRLADDVAPHR